VYSNPPFQELINVKNTDNLKVDALASTRSTSERSIFYTATTSRQHREWKNKLGNLGAPRSAFAIRSRIETSRKRLIASNRTTEMRCANFPFALDLLLSAEEPRINCNHSRSSRMTIVLQRVQSCFVSFGSAMRFHVLNRGAVETLPVDSDTRPDARARPYRGRTLTRPSRGSRGCSLPTYYPPEQPRGGSPGPELRTQLPFLIGLGGVLI